MLGLCALKIHLEISLSSQLTSWLLHFVLQRGDHLVSDFYHEWDHMPQLRARECWTHGRAHVLPHLACNLEEIVIIIITISAKRRQLLKIGLPKVRPTDRLSRIIYQSTLNWVASAFARGRLRLVVWSSLFIMSPLSLGKVLSFWEEVCIPAVEDR